MEKVNNYPECDKILLIDEKPLYLTLTEKVRHKLRGQDKEPAGKENPRVKLVWW